MIIDIDENGTMQFLASDELAGLLDEGEATKVRASHVVPCLPPARWLFQLLRWATGETGAISDWTRRWWPVFTWGWQVQIVNGPHLGTYWRRSEAIAAEIEWLESHDLNRK